MLDREQYLEFHKDCTFVVIHRFIKSRNKLRAGLYCETHGTLVCWLDDDQYKAMMQAGVEDLGSTPEDLAKYQQVKKSLGYSRSKRKSLKPKFDSHNLRRRLFAEEFR